MHKKISIGITVTLMIVTLVVTAVITTAVTMNAYSDIISDIPEREAMYGSLSEIDDIIRSNYSGDTGNENLSAGIASGYLSGLKTGVNIYMTAEEYADYQLKMSGFVKEPGTSEETEKKESIIYKKFGSAGYLKISDFLDTTPQEFRTACKTLQDNSVTAIIIDVRDTNSFNTNAAIEIIDMIVPIAAGKTEAIATVKGKNNATVEVFASDSEAMNIKFAVLINENTSGAGELLAADLVDFGKAVSIGNRTAGCGTYQKIYELSDGGAVVLTVGEIIPYGGTSYNNIGIEPGYIVKASGNTNDLNSDSQFLHAYAVVSQ